MRRASRGMLLCCAQGALPAVGRNCNVCCSPATHLERRHLGFTRRNSCSPLLPALAASYGGPLGCLRDRDWGHGSSDCYPSARPLVSTCRHFCAGKSRFPISDTPALRSVLLISLEPLLHRIGKRIGLHTAQRYVAVGGVWYVAVWCWQPLRSSRRHRFVGGPQDSMRFSRRICCNVHWGRRPDRPSAGVWMQCQEFVPALSTDLPPLLRLPGRRSDLLCSPGRQGRR